MGSIEMIQSKDFIANSHERCKAYKVENDKLCVPRMLAGNELMKKLDEKRELIFTTVPYMNQLYSFVKGANFFSLLTDEEGCILSVIGDEKILYEASSFGMVPGAYMDESSVGTNSIGTALVEGKPIQVSGEEHYIRAYYRWSCSASPIRNSTGKIIGSLNLTGYSECVNLHTLGMVVAVANEIEEMLIMKRYIEELSSTKKFTQTIINSVTSGILTSDLEGNIIFVNRYAANMFGYSQDEMMVMKAWDLLEDWERTKTLVINKQDFTDENVFVNSRTNKLQFNLCAYPHHDCKQKLTNIIFVFKEVRQTRKPDNKVMGHHVIFTFDKIIGKDKNFVQVIDYAKKIADSRSNVLIMGESGTGKELFSQAIHDYSNRQDEPFVALNCGEIPRNLIESELFGYEGGAFTGAKRTGQPGKFEIANGGTIFLDEIGEMPIDMQTRLLRVLEDSTVCRIGSAKEIVVDVRVIAATNKDLNEEVRKGNFRKDLYYRLNVLPIRLPPLRERKADIPILSQFFMERISIKLNKKSVNINEATMKAFLEYDWPGNVREMENIIELMVNTEAVPDIFKVAQSNFGEEAHASMNMEQESTCEVIKENLNLEQIEKNHILKVFNLYNGNITLCAKVLGIGRNTLYRKMEKYGIRCSEMEQCSDLLHLIPIVSVP